jgi:hypothetical protein
MKTLLLLVIGFSLGYATCYYQVPTKLSKGLFALSFNRSGFEEDAAPAPTSTRARARPITSSTDFVAIVTRITSGGSMVIDTGQTVEYLGVSAPQPATANDAADCFSADALNRNRDLVLGKSVRLIRDKTDKDSQGHLLRHRHPIKLIPKPVLPIPSLKKPPKNLRLLFISLGF